MIVDASAIVAIALNEPESPRFRTAILTAPTRGMSTTNCLEALMAVEARLGPEGRSLTEALITELELELFAFDQQQLLAAASAWRRYGKGRHRARLNLGDCCAYAASVTLNEPLLFKGNDFALTDVEVAVW